MIINKLGYLKIPQIFRNFSNSEKNFDKNKLKKKYILSRRNRWKRCI